MSRTPVLAAILSLAALSAVAQNVPLLKPTINLPLSQVAGQQVSFDVSLANVGPVAAEDVYLQILWGSQILSATGDGWLCTSPKHDGITICRRPTLAAGATSKVFITAINSIFAGRSFTRADASASVHGATDGSTFIDLVIFPASRQSDLWMDGLADVPPLAGRERRTIPVTVHNGGPDRAENVMIRGSLYHAYMFYTRAGGAGWTCQTDNVTFYCSTPSLEAGAAATIDVEVEASAGGTILLDTTFTGYDPNINNNGGMKVVQTQSVPAPDRADFERVLLPIALVETPGAEGSLWKTSFTMFNGSSQSLFGVNAFDFVYPFYSGCKFPICPSPNDVAPRAQYEPMLLQPRGTPPGVLMWVRKSVANDIHYDLRIQDVSRQALTWGTEVPVVRERDLRSGAMVLLDVPLQPRFRQTLRIYDASGSTAQAVVRYVDSITGTLLREDQVTLTIPQYTSSYSQAPGWPLFPAYAEVSSIAGLPELSATSRVRIEVQPLSPDAKMWALASVTNNETQHVTLIAPQ